ncbi:ATP-binding protein [Nonomuraea typhae]|uniref:ATP-binding protein n=1 Tax=Nonomuraea typhae TaxID=2603600 RepID=A0ABW7YJ42_9ACTN
MIMDLQILNSRQKYASIPLKYRGLTLDAYRPYSEGSKAALTAARDFVASFPQRCVSEPPEGSRDLVGKGLALIGDPGAGKTTLTAMILNEVIAAHDVSVTFVAYADFVSKLIEQMSVQKLAEKGDPRALDRYWQIDALKRRTFTSPLLGLDDVGKEHQTSSKFAEDEFDRLLRWRHRNALPVVLSSNIALTKWGTVYGRSMASFACEAFTEIPMSGKDLRRRA